MSKRDRKVAFAEEVDIAEKRHRDEEERNEATDDSGMFIRVCW